jgi:four helix bundle protein
MGVRRFEDIQAWQEARILTKQVYAMTREGALSKDFGLRDQLQRASVSVMANIAEGFDCDSHAEFARLLGFARRSAVEIQSLLYAALDAGYITPEIFKTTYLDNVTFEKKYPNFGVLGGRTSAQHPKIRTSLE